MKNTALLSSIKRTPYEVLYDSASRVIICTTHTSREEFNAAENEQQFEISLTTLIVYSERKDNYVFAKETSLNETVEVPSEHYGDTLPNNSIKLCVMCSKNCKKKLELLSGKSYSEASVNTTVRVLVPEVDRGRGDVLDPVFDVVMEATGEGFF
ncbi:hypothetical protein TNCV_619031 [Trichonephila clavipes]|nr:hypothetical protein TNCV_619031 [Trichonephila clavipes]